MQKMNGMFYAPVFEGKTEPVVGPGEFPISVVGLDHGHIYAMVQGLVEAGATPMSVYDDDPAKTARFLQTFPSFAPLSSREEVLNDGSLLLASAIRPDRRFDLGMEAMRAGKDYFADKPGFLALGQVPLIEEAVARTGRKYMIYYGERVHVEGAVAAQKLIDDGVLGEIVNIQILAPHRLSPSTRPAWFWNPQQGGGIITDIGSHQIEQFLSFSHASTARILSSVVGNLGNPGHPEFQDTAQVALLADNNTMGYFRVDWFTPDGMGAWGDGRVFVVGTKATLEIRKYLDVAASPEGDRIYLTDSEGERRLSVHGKTGFPFFGRLIRDCLDRTETSMSQKHVIESMRLALEAQNAAEFVRR